MISEDSIFNRFLIAVCKQNFAQIHEISSRNFRKQFLLRFLSFITVEKISDKRSATIE